ncbi:MAG: flagellar hook assembly protein FlgD [FCB group bacterium]|nr:flagellar hook assembly protein FlgD [FCB group bacterium]
MPDITPTYGGNSTSFLNAYSEQEFSNDLGQDQFLAMLVTQMNYQDPMSPMDSQQMAAQLAQFTSVEQLTQINTNLEDSLTAQLLMNQSLNNTLSAQLMGLEVEASNEVVVLDDGEATSIMYDLPSNASEVTITIYDSDGIEIDSSVLGAQPIGEHTYEWDGKNSQGVMQNDGQYYFEVTATTAEGNDLAVEQYIVGIIDGVTYEQGQAVLMMGNLPVYLPNVTGLNLPPEG